MPFLITAAFSGISSIVAYNYVRSESAKADPVNSAVNLAIVGITCYVAFQLAKRI